MKNLIALCVRRPVTVIMAMSALLLAAVFSALNLPLDRLPEIETARLTVETAYPGLGAEDVRSIVTVPVEDALSPVKGLERIRSVSRDGASLITLDFRWGTDAGRAAVLVREAIDGVYPSLPQGAEKPLVRGGGGQEAHLIVALSAKNGDAAFERDFAEYEMRTRLRRVDGVGAVVLSGGERKEITIDVDVHRAQGMSLAVSDLASMVSSETADIPAGSAKEGEREVIIVSSGKPKALREISRLYFAGGAGPFALNDLAGVRMGAAKPKSVWSFNGSNATALEVWRQSGADPVKLSSEVRRAVEEAARVFERDMDIKIVYDNAPAIVESLQNLIISGIIGAVSVFILLYIFMRNIKLSALAALAVPLSAAAALVALKAGGKSLNGMSLSGAALGIGLVSDTAVVILDALRRAFSAAASPSSEAAPSGGGISGAASPSSSRADDGRLSAADSPSSETVPSGGGIGGAASSSSGRAETIIDTAAALSASSFGGTATTVIVFLPVLFLPGPLGALFGDLALSLASSVAAGWLYAQLALPSLFRLWAPASNASVLSVTSCGQNTNVPFPALEGVYGGLLAKAMRSPRRMALAAAAFSVAGVAFLAARPVVFRAQDAARELVARVDFPAGTAMAAIGRESARLGAALKELPAVEAVIGRAGAEEEDAARRADSGYSPEALTLRCLLAKGAAAEEAAAAIRECLAAEAGGSGAPEISVDAPEDAVQAMLGIATARRLSVKGAEPEIAAARAAEFCAALEGEAGGSFLQAARSPSGEREELRVIPRREAAATAGISAAQIARAAGSVTEGLVASEMEIEGRPVDIRLLGTYAPAGTEAVRGIETIPVSGGRGAAVPLGAVAKVERSRAPRVLARLDRSDVVYIIPYAAQGQDKNLTTVLNRMIAKTTYISDEDESVFKRYKSSLILTIILVLALLYMTMGAQFESFLLPLIFMLTIPFSLAGAGPALFLAGRPVDSGAVLALVVLFGLVVNNGIVLYETSEQNITAGLAPREAVEKGARERFRAVLTTTLTTVIVLLPLAFSPFAHSEQAMALAMLGGCLASTALTVFALPPVFAACFNRARSRP